MQQNAPMVSQPLNVHNAKNGYIKTGPSKIHTLENPELLGLDTSNKAKSDPQGLLFMIKRVPQNFSFKSLGSSVL